VITPYLRGYGTTRFLSSDAVRQRSTVGARRGSQGLLDALKIEKPILAGFDWGARTANIFAALWPERTKAMVSVSGYLIGNQEAGKMPLPPQAESNGGTNSILPPIAVAPATKSTGASSRS
jgi:pimeloyl-ACP methyl ester carboxylesterase